METVMDFIFLGSKITIVTAATKLKGKKKKKKKACSLEEKLWQT